MESTTATKSPDEFNFIDKVIFVSKCLPTPEWAMRGTPPGRAIVRLFMAYGAFNRTTAFYVSYSQAARISGASEALVGYWISKMIKLGKLEIAERGQWYGSNGKRRDKHATRYLWVGEPIVSQLVPWTDKSNRIAKAVMSEVDGEIDAENPAD